MKKYERVRDALLLLLIGLEVAGVIYAAVRLQPLCGVDLFCYFQTAIPR